MNSPIGPRNETRPDPTNPTNRPLSRPSHLAKSTKWIFALLLVAAVSAPVHAAEPSSKDPDVLPGDTFSILLKGVYEPVADGPDLGLFEVNLDDGSFSTTKIYPVSGLPDHDNRPGERKNEKAIGNFYVQFAGMMAAYELPQGALTMEFTGSDVQAVDDGQGGTYIVGTFDLEIKEATGIYAPFIGGSNKMVDILHLKADGTAVEHCICIIRRA